MACTLYVAWDGRLAAYDFGAGHPMAPARVELTIELAQAFGLFAEAGVSVESPVAATDAELELVHDPRYIAGVRLAGRPDPDPSVLDFGLGTEDDPVFVGMHDASALVAGATLAAARAVWTGAAQHGVSIAGGLHHAMRGSASGFCVYNDPAIAIAWLLGQGAGRVAYVDVDVHHGDGVQAAFYGDPRVLTISLHQDPAALWPGTGLPSETGGPGAKGSAVNVALPAGPGTPGGCARSTPWCRRCCASSGRRSWSASTAVIRTGSTRWPTLSCPSTRSAPRTLRSTPWPTRWRAAAGS